MGAIKIANGEKEISFSPDQGRVHRKYFFISPLVILIAPSQGGPRV